MSSKEIALEVPMLALVVELFPLLILVVVVDVSWLALHFA